MNELIKLLVGALVCFRLAELIAVDEGPGDVFTKLRGRLGAYNLSAAGLPDTSLGRGIICPWCIGLWLAIPLALVLFPFEPSVILYWLAIAGGQSVLQKIGGRV